MQYSKEEVAILLNQLGYEVDNKFKFRLRIDDKTPSASINPKNGKIKDFGTGWYGSIIDLMTEFHNYTKSDAFKYSNDVLGKNDLKVEFKKLNTENKVKEKKGFITQNIIDKFIQERKENFSRFSELLKQTLPTLSAESRKQLALKFEIGYTKNGDRLIMPIKDENGNCLTLWKYNKNPSPFIGENGELIQLPKCTFTGARQRKMFNIQGLYEYIKNPKEPIFIMEGEKDCLNALGSGFNAISIGSSTSKIEDKYIHLFKDTNITICYDNDEAGKTGSKMLKEQLKDVCKNIEILDWEEVAKKLNFKDKLKKGFDFTDFLEKINSTKEKEKTIKR